ncbi:MAG: NAD(P)/FAD-dependent oxidoreductase [Pyrinomonadaceae bacterium]
MAVDSFDVIIVGGGPAGTSAAVHLAQAGVCVMLAEQKVFPRAKLCGEFISPECLAHFARLGVLDQMHAARPSSLARTDFYAPSGRRVSVPSEWFGGRASSGDAMGLSRAEMDQRLLRRAREAGAQVLEGTQAVGPVFDEKGRVRGVRLRLDGGGELELYASITIDATGRTRSLARRAARHLRQSDNAHDGRRSPLVAFKAHLEEASAAEGACEIYFYRGGYGGLNRVEGGVSNLCFIARAVDVRRCAGDAGRVMREIVMSNRRAAEALVGARVRSEWLAVALESFGRHELVPADGLFAIGDAASFIDPFTGSGMLSALESGELVAQAITEALPALRAGSPFNDLAARYRAGYRARFDSRLRVCSLLRRAAFAPRLLTEAATLALGASATLRRALARATRGAPATSV